MDHGTGFRQVIAIRRRFQMLWGPAGVLRGL